MIVNSETIHLNSPASLADFLKEAGYQTNRIAVELNGEIIPKAQYENIMLSEADTLEIVCFVGGG